MSFPAIRDLAVDDGPVVADQRFTRGRLAGKYRAWPYEPGQGPQGATLIYAAKDYDQVDVWLMPDHSEVAAGRKYPSAVPVATDDAEDFIALVIYTPHDYTEAELYTEESPDPPAFPS